MSWSGFSIIGAIAAASGALMGAFGAHALKHRLEPALLDAFTTGVHYHLYHALGLFAVAFVASRLPASSLVQWSGWLMVAGIVLFSGSLYLLSMSGMRWLGPVTPVGGIAFIAAWVLLAVALIRG